MKKIYTLFALLLLCAATSVAQTTITIANTSGGKLPTAAGYGTFSGQTFTTAEASGLANLTITASSGLTIGEQQVNVANYGYCFRFVTSAPATDYTVTLTAPTGYVITGYYLACSANTKDAVHTLTSADGKVSVVASAPPYNSPVGPKAFTVTGLDAQTTSFTINTANKANTLYIPTFYVYVMTPEEHFNQLVEYLKTIPYGTELNQYRISYQGQDYTEQLPALVEQFGNTGYSPMAYNVLKTLVANATMTLNMPEAGTFLRITSCHETILSGTPASGRLSLTTNADASTIFYFDGTKLLNYGNGVYANGRDAGSVGGNGISYWFEESTMKMGAYAIRFNPDGNSDRFLYAWGIDRNYADQNGEDHANCVWTLEKLTELPITMHDGLDGRYYATFSAPVAISHVDVGIHKVKLEGNVAKYSEVTEQSATGIPANTGVLLISDSPDELLAFIGDYEGETIDTDLQPITAAVNSHEGLFFGLSTENKLGFFKLMEGGETTPTTGGFKAYLNAPASAKGVELVADNEATGVEAIDGLTPNPSPNGKGSMYNLQGQRVTKAQKGVFIQNGKKVVVR